jgi:hypothetical protein
VGSEGVVPPFLTSTVGGRVSFTPGLLYPGGKSPRYALNRKVSGAQSRSECYREDKKISLARILTSAVQPIAFRYTD